MTSWPVRRLGVLLRPPPHAGWRRFGTQAASLLGVAGVAICQPVLDLFGRNPTFFVAGRYSAGQIVAFALVVALAPAAVAVALVGLARAVHRRAGAVAYVALLALLAGMFGLSVARAVGVRGLVPAGLLAGVIALAVVVADRCLAPARQFLTYLAAGNLVFVGSFLFTSPTARLVSAEAGAGTWATEPVELEGPVVVLVLDELPLTSLLRPDGSIDAARFPRFAELAARSTWFRNASTESTETFTSVPSILSGRRGGDDDVPSLRDYPDNLFTLVGDRYPVHRYETVTDLCPPDVCPPPERGRLHRALADAAVVYGHRVLPEPLGARLPPVDAAWGGFLGDASEAPPASEELRELLDKGLEEWVKEDFGAVSGLRGVLAGIDGGPSLNVAHVLLPHQPWRLTPELVPATHRSRTLDLPESPDDPAFDRTVRELQQAHLLQVGAADTLVGELIDHLDEVGAWDDALVVVVADHGIDLSPPELTRDLLPGNEDEVLRIPLFIKAPGQRQGEVRDDPATTLDVVPSVVDLLDVEVDRELPGHSLFDGSPAPRRLLESELDRALAVVAEREETFFQHGEGWAGVAAVGPHGDLVGRTVDELVVGEPSRLSVTLDEQDAFDDVSLATGPVPRMVGGTVTGSGGPPDDLVVAVNGVVAGTFGGFSPEGEGWRGSGLLAPVLVDGRNEVVVYEVERAAGTVVLHPSA